MTVTPSEVALKHDDDRRQILLSFVRVITTRRPGPNGPKRGVISKHLLTNGRLVTTATAAAAPLKIIVERYGY